MLGAAQKSPEAFRTISEVAADLDVPQHVLRFWETKFSAVKPLKRGGGRRYYRPDDIDLLRGIRTLLYSDGLTIKGVQKVLREKGARYVTDLGRHSGSLLHAVPDGRERTDEQAELSNVRRFPSGGDARARPTGDRDRFEHLLEELLELKGRLQDARRRS